MVMKKKKRETGLAKKKDMQHALLHTPEHVLLLVVFDHLFHHTRIEVGEFVVDNVWFQQLQEDPSVARGLKIGKDLAKQKIGPTNGQTIFNAHRC